MTTTLAVQIGNSDDKLTQTEWHKFVWDVQCLINTNAAQIYFFGAPMNWEPWQNVAWIFTLKPDTEKPLWKELERLGRKYQQDSIAVTEGITRFV